MNVISLAGRAGGGGGDQAPRWLKDAFAARGCGIPRLLRDVSSAVWSDGKIVAKVHHHFDEANREQRAASAFASAGCLTADPIGLKEIAGTHFTVSWWAWTDVEGPASPIEAAKWLREAHDRASILDLPSARPLPFDRPPHPAAAELHDALAVWRQRAREAHRWLTTLPSVVIHGDANPTNIVRTADGVLALDFGSAGTGARVIDIATVAVLAVETGTGTLDEVIAAYGEHEDVHRMRLSAATSLVAIARAQACAWVPWIDEGWDRLNALERFRPYVFSDGGHPK